MRVTNSQCLLNTGVKKQAFVRLHCYFLGQHLVHNLNSYSLAGSTLKTETKVQSTYRGRMHPKMPMWHYQKLHSICSAQQQMPLFLWRSTVGRRHAIISVVISNIEESRLCFFKHCTELKNDCDSYFAKLYLAGKWIVVVWPCDTKGHMDNFPYETRQYLSTNLIKEEKIQALKGTSTETEPLTWQTRVFYE